MKQYDIEIYYQSEPEHTRQIVDVAASEGSSPFAAPMLIMVNLCIFCSIKLLVDLSSHGVNYEIQLGCHSDNLGKNYLYLY